MRVSKPDFYVEDSRPTHIVACMECLRHYPDVRLRGITPKEKYAVMAAQGKAECERGCTSVEWL